MTDNNKRRLKFLKSIYGREAYEKGLKITYGITTYTALWILGYDTIEELEVKYTDEQILKMYDENFQKMNIPLLHKSRKKA